MAKKEGTPTKAEFVRALPATMPAKEVVEKAKEAGLKLSPAYVYVIRSQGRAAGSDQPKEPRAKAASKGAEARLLAAAGELGLTRSIELLQAEKARLVRLLR
ncbi:MAG TPA: hypothetical protein VLM85_33035 [Polyangiaceae bacterium]|nr:hypothetical protein [Polyangiaceae bacterium]